MYTPNDFSNENTPEILEFIRQNNFGLLISEVNHKPWASHIPFVLNVDGTKLTAHIARANIQWKHFDFKKEVLVIFQGSHSYISSSWYDHENVPTWNYIAVHVYGKLRIIEDKELKESLRQLVDHHEHMSSKPISVDQMTSKFLDNEIRGIVAFEISVNEIQAAYKLSQNRDSKNNKKIIEELENRGDPSSAEIARQMKKHGPHK